MSVSVYLVTLRLSVSGSHVRLSCLPTVAHRVKMEALLNGVPPMAGSKGTVVQSQS